ncbi:MAG: SLBB domain-containing protein [bacterium]|nr:SLBB domain-containing protein [bacterium]
MVNSLINKIKFAGVVGAGGAGFPTHIKLDTKVDWIIVNGAECEPLLNVDPQLVCRYADRLVDAVVKIREYTGAKKVTFGIKKKQKESCATLRLAINQKSDVEVFELPDIYPAGDEHILVYEVTGRIVPESGIPLQVGVVVINVETLLNVSYALEDIPVTETYLSVVGNVKKPVTVRVPIGSPIREVIRLAGGMNNDADIVLEGGPMMGKVVFDLDTPVTKTTKGLVILPADNVVVKRKLQRPIAMLQQIKAACETCLMCTDLCPRYLLGHNLQPHMIMRGVSYGINTEAEIITQAWLCCECGVCDLYACPMDLVPREINAMLKKLMAEKKIPNPHNRTDLQPRWTRNGRQTPLKRLILRLGLTRYQSSAPFIETEYQPKSVTIRLRQHLGAPSAPIVQRGQRVSKGQCIADIPEGARGARIHSSIAGIVKEITEQYIRIESP